MGANFAVIAGAEKFSAYMYSFGIIVTSWFVKALDLDAKVYNCSPNIQSLKKQNPQK